MPKRRPTPDASLNTAAVADVAEVPERQRMIAEAAYYRALHRGFSAGSAEDDWLQAEQDINNALLRPQSRATKPATPKKPRTRARIGSTGRDDA